MGKVDADQIAMLREVLATTGWLERIREFGRVLRVSPKEPGGLLLIGTPAEEPWHLAAHLDDESRFNRIPELKPTLVRWAPAADAPPHLRVGLDRIEAARRGETLLVVAPAEAPVPLLERVDDARRTGAMILTLGSGDHDLAGLADESLTVPPEDQLVSFDAAQHLVSAAAGQVDGRGRWASDPALQQPRPARLTPRQRLAKLLNAVSGPTLPSP